MRMAFWGRQQNDTEVSHVNDDDDPDDEDFGGVDDAVFSSEREREKGGRGPSGTRSRAEAIARRGGGGRCKRAFRNTPSQPIEARPVVGARGGGGLPA